MPARDPDRNFSKLLAVILLVTGCLLPVAADTGSSTAVSINVNGVSVASAAGSLTITMPYSERLWDCY